MKANKTIVLAYFEEMGLPSPVTEHKFAEHITFEGKDGRVRQRQWAFDYAWLEEKVALEIEGGIWTGGGHNRGKGFSKDILKYNTATKLGWRVVRCVPADTCMQETIDLLRSLVDFYYVAFSKVRISKVPPPRKK